MPQTLDGWSELDDENPVHRAVSSHSVDADTYLSEAAPSSAYNSSDSGTLSDGIGQQSRILLRFPMNFTQSDTVHEANIELECTTEILGSPELKVYVAEMEEFWNSSFASWNVYENNQLWDLAGADERRTEGHGNLGIADWKRHLDAERHPLAQHGSLKRTLPVRILASYGAEYACAMSESIVAADRPTLNIDATTGTAASAGATVSTDLPVPDGAPWMEADFLLKPVTTPVLSYAMNNGTDVEIQLSNSAEWRSSSDLAWHFSTLWSSFASTGTTGSYVLPRPWPWRTAPPCTCVRSVDANDSGVPGIDELPPQP